MYYYYLQSELKKWVRDPMIRFMLIYPLFFGIIGRYILPRIAENTAFSIEMYADFILTILTLMIPQIYGAIFGFSILDDRDDSILTSIRITPLSIHQFLSFKFFTVLILGYISCIFVMWFSQIGNLSLLQILLIAFVASLGSPVTGFLINAFAKNKIEGFAIMKSFGTTLLFPFLALFFVDYKQFFFAFVPGFWPAKAISVLIQTPNLNPLSFREYLLIGFIYVVLLNIITYPFFLKRIRQ